MGYKGVNVSTPSMTGFNFNVPEVNFSDTLLNDVNVDNIKEIIN